MKDRVIITGYSGSLAKIIRELLKDDYEIIALTSNKEKVNNKDIYFWDTSTNEIDGFICCNSINPSVYF